LVQNSPHRARTGYRLADLCLETGRRRVLRGRENVPLTGLPFAILRELVEGAPNLVTHRELIERAWGPWRIVTPESLAQNIKRLRKALLFDRLVENSNPDTLVHDNYDRYGLFLRSTGRLEDAKATSNTVEGSRRMAEKHFRHPADGDDFACDRAPNE
jgi:hypothetical protein